MKQIIDWYQLEKNCGSKELSFEYFCFHIAYKKFKSYGKFEYFYNTPGSEFYLKLNKDLPEFNAKKGEIIGWQAKFWLNQSDSNNSPLHKKNREELIEGFKKSLKYKSRISAWIICTPGEFSNTEVKKVKPVSVLENELQLIKQDINIYYWNKPIFEAFYFIEEGKAELEPIYKHYFSSLFIGFEFIKLKTQEVLSELENKVDASIYTENETDNKIYSTLFIQNYIDEIDSLFSKIKHFVKEIDADLLTKNVLEKNNIINKCHELLNNRVNLCNKLINIWNSDDVEIDEKLNKLSLTIKDENNIEKSLVIELNSQLKKYRNEKNNASDINESWLNRSIETSNDIFSMIFGSEKAEKDGLVQIIELINGSNINILADPGFGKTALVFRLTKKLLDNNHPVILLRGSRFANTDTLGNQILKELDLDKKYSFEEFLIALDDLGFLKKIKVPIIIDGLNESEDTLFWSNKERGRNELFRLIKKVGKYKNLILITTCRTRYKDSIFNVRSEEQVPNVLIHKGIDDENIEEAIEKYFTKFNIVVKNKDYKKLIFKYPLLLNLFSKINSGKKVIVGSESIYSTLEEYLDNVLPSKISSKLTQPIKYLENEIVDRINSFGSAVFSNRTRGVEYPEEATQIFDKKDLLNISDWKNTVLFHLLDEDVLLYRQEELDNKEFVNFTFDMVGGFVIAKSICNSLKQTKKDKKSLTSIIDQIDLHPLKEDIFRSLNYLFPKLFGQHLYEVIDNEYVNKTAIEDIDLHTSCTEYKNSLKKLLFSNLNSQLMDLFFEKIINLTIQNRDYSNNDLLLYVISLLNQTDIDLHWSESIRKNRILITKYLLEKIDSVQFGSKTYKKNEEMLTFLCLLFTSTDKAIRDGSTKLAVLVSIDNPKEYIQTCNELYRLNDHYLRERLLAVLCGFLLRKNDKNITAKAIDWLINQYIPTLEYPHVLILNYIETIFDFAKTKYQIIIPENIFSHLKVKPWYEDPTCKRVITKNKHTIWGYGPIGMDFGNYTIGSISKYREFYPKKNKLKTLTNVIIEKLNKVYYLLNIPRKRYMNIDSFFSTTDCIALVMWRIKQLGYKESNFSEVDKQIAKEEPSYSRIDSGSKIERYGKKYAWISFFELCGQMILDGALTSKYEKSFRISKVDIDPSFPNLIMRRQLIIEPHVPDEINKIQKWITKNAIYFKEMHKISLPENKNKWILLNGYLQQNKKEFDVGINIYLDSFIVKKNEIQHLLSKLKVNDETYMFEERSYPYLFAGEIPWSSNIEKDTIDNDDYIIIPTCSHYSWEFYHSQFNQEMNFPFLNKRMLLNEEELIFDLNTFNMSTKNGKEISIFLSDKYSHFLFINKTYLDSYLKKNNYSLIWREHGMRFGESKEIDKIQVNLNPSVRNFINTEVYK